MQQSIRCSRCGSPNYPGQQYCWNCGSQMGSVCPSCGAPLEHNAKFCGSCGAQMGPGSQQQGSPGQSQSYGAPGRQQQYSSSQRSYQQGGWQAPQPPPPPSPEKWNAPASSYSGDWAPRRQQSAMPLVILLVVLLFGLAGFAYWAFFGNPPWANGGGISSPIKGAPTISISSTDNISATVTIQFDTTSSVEARIDYGTDTSYAKSTEWETNYATSHTINLTGLNFGSRYYYRILTRDKDNKQNTTEFPAFRAGSS